MPILSRESAIWVGFAPDNDQKLYAIEGPGRPKLRSRTMRIATAVNQCPNLHAETQAADFRALPWRLAAFKMADPRGMKRYQRVVGTEVGFSVGTYEPVF